VPKPPETCSDKLSAALQPAMAPFPNRNRSGLWADHPGTSSHEERCLLTPRRRMRIDAGNHAYLAARFETRLDVDCEGALETF